MGSLAGCWCSDWSMHRLEALLGAETVPPLHSNATIHQSHAACTNYPLIEQHIYCLSAMPQYFPACAIGCQFLTPMPQEQDTEALQATCCRPRAGNCAADCHTTMHCHHAAPFVSLVDTPGDQTHRCTLQPSLATACQTTRQANMHIT